MNQEQFQEFLRVQQAQQEQLTQLFQLLVTTIQSQRTEPGQNGTPTPTSSITTPQDNTCSSTQRLAIFKSFDLEKFHPDGRVEEYIECFEAKCQMFSISNEIQKDLLLNCLSPDVFHELKIALTPNYNTSTYTDIKSKLLDLYRIKKTRYRALTEFWNCVRLDEETMEHYSNRLKELSKDCGYDDNLLERQLRDRFATGLNHVELETDLKQKWPELLETCNGETKEVTFTQIFAVAQSRERAEQDTPGTNIKRIKRPPFPKRKTTNRQQRQTDNSSPRQISTTQCLRCGKHERHHFDRCPAKTHICDHCHIEGHFENCCIKTGRAYITSGTKKTTNESDIKHRLHRVKHRGRSSQSSQSESHSSESEDEDDLVCSVTGKRSKDCKRIDTIINGVKCTMDWDPGSTFSIINTTMWKKIGAPTLTTAPTLKAYGNYKLKLKGLTDVTVEVGDKQRILPVIVMKNAHPMLFGLHWSEMFGMGFPKPVYSIKINGPTTLRQVLDRYATLFDGKLGKVNGYQVNIHIKAGAEPVHMPARPIKFSMKKNIEIELERLVSEGIIHQVDPNLTPVEWATPTVNVIKSNGTIRICGDYRSTINPVLIKHLHPVPIFDQLRQNLSNGKFFSKIDLKDAYLQFEIAADSKKYLTLSTHKGYFQYNRMPFGIATAPSIFQHYLDKLLGDLPNVAVYFDDIAISGENITKHLQTLSSVFSRLQQAGLKVNLKKCTFLQNEIEYLGHTIDSKGIRPTKAKIEAITKATPPTNTKELRSFLGLVNFYERFIPNLHSLCADLHTLTGNKQPWRWTEYENEIFEQTKACIASSKTLVTFDEKRPLYLACDASEKGVGAILFHKNGNIDQPIAFASRKLRTAESRYSVIDREALAILFGIKKFDQYLRGTKFYLVTDHKPLIHLLGTQRNLPKLVNNRLIRWALLIGSYSYEIVYRKGENNILADCLSRLPNKDEKPSSTERAVHKITSRLLSNNMADLDLTEDSIKEKTLKDPVLVQVMQCLKTGWRNLEYNGDLKSYFRKRNELSIENKILMWHGRIIVPKSLCSVTLNYLHRGHPGISAMRALARFYVWWPSLEEDIDTYVKRCRRCQENRPNNPELPVFSWSIPEKVWERIHIDFAGPFEGTHWLVLCDALSKWIEIKPMKYTTSRNLCDVLDEIFCTFGLPELIVSDNGPQFTSCEFKNYCKDQGIHHVTSAPYHPRTNGLAERLVRTFKSRMTSTEGDIKQRLREFLFSYRNTPHTTTGKSPAQIMFGRQLNCLLSNIRPNRRRMLQYKQVQENIGASSPNFQPGDSVFIKTHLEKSWQPATVQARTHKYSYIVTTPSGEEKRRHADHIRTRLSEQLPNAITPKPILKPVDNTTPSSASLYSAVGNNSTEIENLLPSTPLCSMSKESVNCSSESPNPMSSSQPTSSNGVPSVTPQFTVISDTVQRRRGQRTIRPPRRLVEEM